MDKNWPEDLFPAKNSKKGPKNTGFLGLLHS